MCAVTDFTTHENMDIESDEADWEWSIARDDRKEPENDVFVYPETLDTDTLCEINKAIVYSNGKARPSKQELKAYLEQNLNEEQRRVFGVLISSVEEGISRSQTSTFILDSRPGTGKTFTIAAVSSVLYAKTVHYVVFTCNLESNMSRFANVQSYTVCKYFKRFYDKDYSKVISMWGERKDDDKTMLEYICGIVEEVVRKQREEHQIPDLLVVDEMTTLSPWTVLFFFVYSRVVNCVLVYMGDHNQLDAISKSRWHNKNNFSLVKQVAQVSCFMLVQRVRQTGENSLRDMLEKICILLEAGGGDGCYTTPMDFHNKFLIYRILADNDPSVCMTESIAESPTDGTEEEEECCRRLVSRMYLSQFHEDITARQKGIASRFERFCVKSYFSSSPFSCERQEQESLDTLFCDSKFCPFIILCNGSSYVHFNVSKRTTDIVKLVSFDVNSSTAILERSNGQLVNIKKINIYSILPKPMARELRAALKSSTVYGFPIKNMNSTYHAVQGMTIEEGVQIELNMDCQTVNAFYVGLSRIKRLSQLYSVVTKELSSLRYTEQRLGQNPLALYKVSDEGKRPIIKVTRSYDVFKRKSVKDHKCGIAIPYQICSAYKQKIARLRCQSSSSRTPLEKLINILSDSAVWQKAASDLLLSLNSEKSKISNTTERCQHQIFDYNLAVLKTVVNTIKRSDMFVF